MRFNRQISADHCGTFVCLILIEFMHMCKNMKIPKGLHCNANQIKEIITILYKEKSQKHANMLAVSYKNKVDCEICKKTFIGKNYRWQYNLHILNKKCEPILHGGKDK